MRVEIDDRSGFCFGVVRAISKAEEAIAKGDVVYSLGDIVHNRVEVQRLQREGLITITHEELERAASSRLFIRAHGEPPSTYALARELGIELVDATCPVVAKLQRRVVRAYAQMQEVDGQVVILGKRGHAEVVGLTGQVGNRAIVIESEDDLGAVDFTRPIYFLSQTTQSIALFEHIGEILRQRLDKGISLIVDDTICRQLSSRDAHLEKFAKSYDIIIFVSGAKSSNGRVLFEVCRRANVRSYAIEEPSQLQQQWFEGAQSVGVCGATSTPKWQMQQVADAIMSY